MDPQVSELLRLVVEQQRVNTESIKALRDELFDLRRVNHELVTVLGDLRDELEHVRTARARTERVQNLADLTRPRARKRG